MASSGGAAVGGGWGRAGFLRAALALLIGLAATVASATTTVVVIGDTGDCSEGPPLVADAILDQIDPRNSWLLEVGDLAYPTASKARLRECHEPIFGRHRFPRRLAVPGNHDGDDPGMEGFLSLYPEPLPRMVEFGAWRAFLLDSNLRGEAWEKQLSWVEEAARESEGRCVFAVWHHPAFSSARRRPHPELQRLWAAVAGVATFTLHGHDHFYERLAPRDGAGRRNARGSLSFISGNGGAPFQPLSGALLDGSQAVAGEWGYLMLQFEETEFRWQARAVSGGVLDQGRAPCRPIAGY